MGRSHLLTGACVALAVSLFVGCAAKPKQPVAAKHPAGHPVARGAEAQPHAADGGADAVPGDGPTITPGEVAPQSIAQHTQVYARNLESLLAKRATNPKQPQAAAATQPVEATDDAAPEPTAGAANAAMKLSPPPAPKKTPVNAEASVGEAPAAAPPAAVVPADKEPAPAPASRVAVTKSPTVPATADLLQQQVTTRAKQYPQDVAAQLEYQLLQFLRDESVPDLAGVAPLAADDRELLTTLLDGLSNFRNGLRAEANMLASKKVSPLLEMADRLRAQGELSIPTALLCSKVERFGVYEPMQPAQFKAGAPSEAVLYCEVANFSSQLGDGRQWETRLKHECVLYSETGLNVWHTNADPVTDQSRNRRHDFHVVRRLRLPAVPVGRYLLKVTVTDLQVNRVAEATVPIQVVAQ